MRRASSSGREQPRLRTSLARAIALAALVFAGPAGAGEGPLVRAVDAAGMTVADLDRSIAFYARVLDFEKVSDVAIAGESWERLTGIPDLRARVVRMRLGDESIVLSEFEAPRGRPLPEGSRSNDRWFQHVAIIVSDMDRAYERLQTYGVEHVSPGPQTLPDWNHAAGGIRAFYFKDPDGHVLEILQFPPGKGADHWHDSSDRLFRGIDHTAIVVADTEASLRFYRDVLGMRVAGESENHGIEQERLNAVAGARLRITGLRAASGPGVELLEYLAPRDGRPLPPDQRANDVAHWQTRLLVKDADAATRALRADGFAFISPHSVDVVPDALGFDEALLVRDPDGHAMEIVQP
jgi:catechol 2,3-dioxygenase-like lactoylglutathione lyase family enzyme